MNTLESQTQKWMNQLHLATRKNAQDLYKRRAICWTVYKWDYEFIPICIGEQGSIICAANILSLFFLLVLFISICDLSGICGKKRCEISVWRSPYFVFQTCALFIQALLDILCVCVCCFLLFGHPGFTFIPGFVTKNYSNSGIKWSWQRC